LGNDSMSDSKQKSSYEHGSTQQTAHTNRFYYAATIPTIWTHSMNL